MKLTLFEPNLAEWGKLEIEGNEFDVYETENSVVFGKKTEYSFLQLGYLPKRTGQTKNDLIQELADELTCLFLEGEDGVKNIVII